MLAQNVETQRVDRAARDIIGTRPQGLPEPRRNFFGCLVRECDGANAARIEVVDSDEVVDPGDETESLPGAGPGHDKHRPEWRLNGEALLGKGSESGHDYSLARGSDGGVWRRSGELRASLDGR